MVSQTQDVFDHTHPLEVDIGSGKGRFLLARAAAFPLVNFIGIERQRRRVDKVAAKATCRSRQPPPVEHGHP